MNTTEQTLFDKQTEQEPNEQPECDDLERFNAELQEVANSEVWSQPF